MEYMHELKDMLCEELEKVVQQGELTPGSLDVVQKLTHSLKSIEAIIAMEEEYSNEGSYANMGNAYYRGGSYRGGSYAGGSYRGGQSRAYSRRGYMRGRSRDDDASKMVEKLERMMEQTSDPSVKQAIQQAVESLDM